MKKKNDLPQGRRFREINNIGFQNLVVDVLNEEEEAHLLLENKT